MPGLSVGRVELPRDGWPSRSMSNGGKRNASGSRDKGEEHRSLARDGSIFQIRFSSSRRVWTRLGRCRSEAKRPSLEARGLK
ncbi:hypothetical protein NL676_021747 [Syzygium grande]|nr:hypothetical protein NL676_021747 [Syzygium grande]